MYTYLVDMGGYDKDNRAFSRDSMRSSRANLLEEDVEHNVEDP